MTKQITLEEALKLVDFYHATGWGWQVGAIKVSVNGPVCGDVHGDVVGSVYGDVYSDVYGDVRGIVHRNVGLNVYGKINGRYWVFAETPKEKLQRLVEENATKEELIAVIEQLEDN